MVKKISNIGIAVKAFLEKGFSQIWIARKLGIKNQNVNYWAKHLLVKIFNPTPVFNKILKFFNHPISKNSEKNEAFTKILKNFCTPTKNIL